MLRIVYGLTGTITLLLWFVSAWAWTSNEDIFIGPFYAPALSAITMVLLGTMGIAFCVLMNRITVLTAYACGAFASIAALLYNNAFNNSPDVVRFALLCGVLCAGAFAFGLMLILHAANPSRFNFRKVGAT